ncbi:MAG: amidohydrolase family protein [Planctomycetes bacterium]|nr:amidohydrolase family protein [Planctomycetota bacterium]
MGSRVTVVVRRLTILAVLAIVCMSSWCAWAGDQRNSRGGSDEKKPAAEKNGKDAAAADDESDDEKKKKKVKEDRFFALRGGIVHTVSRGELRDVTILVKNGKVVEIDRGVKIPEGAEVLDARDFHIYPGLIAASSGGIFGSGAPEESTNVYSLSMTLALAGGITTALAGNTVVKLTYGSVDDMVVRRDVFKKLRYSTSDPNQRRELRAKFEKVRQYLRDLEAYEEDKKTDPDAEAPKDDWIKGEFKTCLQLLKHEAVAKIDANTAQEILSVSGLATRYGIQIVVVGAVEGWTVASAMARAGLSAIVTPRRQWTEDQELNRPTGSSIENAAILYRTGVPVAVVPGISSIMTWGLAGRDLLHLNMEAAFAVRGGLSNEEAIRTITIDAARLLGVDHRVGSIEIGKDADFLVCDGDLLHYMTHVRWTVVNGRVVYDKKKDTLFDHIRPDGDRSAPPPDDYWPRTLGATK